MIDLNKAKAYKSYDNKWILFGDGMGFQRGCTYFSPAGGQTFYQLEMTGWGNGHMGYYDPHHQTKVDLLKRRDEDFIHEETVTGLGRIYRPAVVPTSYEVVLLPHVRESRYFLALLEGSILVYVSCDKYYPSEPPNVYLGTMDAMRKLVVLSEDSTGIMTDEGLLEIRNCYLPSWEGLRMVPLKMENYIFEEANGRLTVTPKK